MKKLLFVLLSILVFIPCSNMVCVFADSGSVILHYGNKTWSYEMFNIYKGDNIEILYKQEQYKKMITENNLKELKNKLVLMGTNEADAYRYLFPKFESLINEIKKEINEPVVNPQIHFSPSRENMFHFTQEKYGLMVDENLLYNEMLAGNKSIEINTKLIQPNFTKNDLQHNTKLRSVQSTSFSGSESGRKYNLLKAVNLFNGMIVMPGEEISFNKVTGERSYQNGFKDAIVISNGEFTKGAGGGVCQASTTIYNAALMAGLKIKSVNRHSLPVHYVEQGFDAMVNDSGADMCFTNNTNYPIYIKTYTKNERVYAEVYGEDLKGITYKKTYQKIRDIEPPPPKVIPDLENQYIEQIKYKGEYYTKRYAQLGYEVNAYLEKYQDGKLLEKRLIRHETYAPQQSIIYEGAQEPVLVESQEIC